MPGQLQDRVAVVTGASQGIGQAVANRFAEEGATVVLSELDMDTIPALDAVAEEIATRHSVPRPLTVITEVTDPHACDQLMQSALENHGHLDIVAHATAVGQTPGPTVELAPEEWSRILAVNATGCFLLARSAIPRLRTPGAAIVFTGSIHGLVGSAGRAAYNASKGALRLLTQSLALELAEQGIRVNGVAPGVVESELIRRGLQAFAKRESISLQEAQRRRDSSIPLKRQAEAAEVAEAFLFLASPASSYVTGSWLDVNGGAVVR